MLQSGGCGCMKDEIDSGGGAVRCAGPDDAKHVRMLTASVSIRFQSWAQTPQNAGFFYLLAVFFTLHFYPVRGFLIMFYVYVLYAEKFDKYYIGHTNNLDARIARHNSYREEYTKKYVPWTHRAKRPAVISCYCLCIWS